MKRSPQRISPRRIAVEFAREVVYPVVVLPQEYIDRVRDALRFAPVLLAMVNEQIDAARESLDT